MVELKHFSCNVITGFLVVVLSLNIVLATPGVPHQFYGNVLINGNSAPDGILIDVYDVTERNTYVGGTFTEAGNYGYQPNIFYVPDPKGDRNGDILVFYVNDIEAVNYTFSSGASTKLDLSVTIPGFHFCGDGTCDSNEGCSSCPEDCSCSSGYECKNNACVKINTGSGSSSSSSSSGSGGGGSSYIPPATQNETSNKTSNKTSETSGSDTGNDTYDKNETIICEENWKCSEWFECFNNKQKRVCTDLNNCGTTIKKPKTVQKCVEALTENETSDENNSFLSITGRFLTSPTGIVSIFGLILAIIVGFLVYQKKFAGKK